MQVDRARWWRRFTRGPQAALCLLVLCLALYVPGQWGMPAIDRDESRFVQASRQMLKSTTLEGWMIPRIQDRDRLNKPPLIYWSQAGVASVATGRAFGTPPDVASGRDAIWMYRLPSLLAAIAAVFFTWRMGCSMFDPRAGFLGAMLFAASPVIIWESRQGRADMLLVACTTGSMWALWEGFKQARAGGRVGLTTWVGLWMAVGLGTLTKGPITAMVVVLTALGVSLLGRSLRWTWKLKPLVGVTIVAACVLPWLLVVMDIKGAKEYWDIIQKETLGRMGSAAEGHGGPPGYHLLLMVVLLGAGSLLIWPALARGWRVGLTRDRSARGLARVRSIGLGRPSEGFLLCWLVLPWIVFEISSTKLPHYTMPMYPALALLSARGVLAADAQSIARSKFVHGLAWLWISAMTAAVLFFTVAATFAAFRVWGQFPAMIVAVLGMTATGVLAYKAAVFHLENQWLNLQRTGIAMSVAISLALGLVGSILPEIRVSRNVAQSIMKLDPSFSRPIVAVDYAESAPGKRDHGGFVEDSLIFETQGTAQRLSGSDLPEWITKNPGGFVCIEERALKRYLGLEKTEALPEDLSRAEHLRVLDMVPGFNYSKGKLVKVYVAEAVP
jgi:4-amino-4-deoxy-L-arabinose transferase-like glycosyltransferase